MPTKKSATKKSSRVKKTPAPEEKNDAQAEQPKKSASKKKSPRKVVRRVRQANTDGERRPAEGKDDDSKAPEKQKNHADRKDDGRKKDPRKDRDDRRRSGRGRNSGRGKANRVEVDPDDLAKRAWKIYQADIAEEGIALVNNSIGRELAQRSFELARIFLEVKASHNKETPEREPEREPAEPSPPESDEAE